MGKVESRTNLMDVFELPLSFVHLISVFRTSRSIGLMKETSSNWSMEPKEINGTKMEVCFKLICIKMFIH